MTTSLDIAGGILLAVIVLAMLGFGLHVVVNHFRDDYWLDADETDDHINRRRSGLAIMTDHGTGRQYLVTQKGGITPRLPRQD